MLAGCESQCVSFFFFQAEDGIRDLTVTGVQTCALPISGKCITYLLIGVAVLVILEVNALGMISGRGNSGLNMIYETHKRSEERRVGKECRSRWSPYH